MVRSVYRIDYHMHSCYSFDGSEPVDALCLAAIERGCNEIAITDHLDIFMTKTCEDVLDAAAAYDDIARAQERFRGRLIIKTGVELGQPQVNPGEADRFFKRYAPDFVIGSVHNMEHDLDVYYYDWSRMNEFEVYDRYITWLEELARTADFDVLGHLTYPLRYVYEARGTRFPLEDYFDRFRNLFRILNERGKGIECNTSGLLQPIGQTLPPLELLKLYRECGGEIITIGSDAHRAAHVALTVPQGEALVREAGFRYVTTYTERRPEFHPID